MYSECATPCGSCRDQQMTDEHCSEECMAGCACPDGQLMDDYGQCVPPNECTCYDAYDPEEPIKNAGEKSQRGCAEW